VEVDGEGRGADGGVVGEVEEEEVEEEEVEEEVVVEEEEEAEGEELVQLFGEGLSRLR
jgi:hypothetical protein